MVSKASDDLPDPESPVKTTSLSRGIDSVTFLRLCSRAPRMVIWSVGMDSCLFLVSCDRKRSARGGDQLPVPVVDPTLRDHRPAACMDDLAGGAQVLADLRDRDERQLEVEAHRTDDARLEGSQRAPHGRIGEGADDTAVNDTGMIGHVRGWRHLDHGRTLARVHKPQTEPAPGRRVGLGDLTHGPGLLEPRGTSTQPLLPTCPARPTHRPR